MVDFANPGTFDVKQFGVMKQINQQGEPAFAPHSGHVHLRHGFTYVFYWLQKKGPLGLATNGGFAFEVRSAVKNGLP